MTFDQAVQAASEIPDLLSYSAWCDFMEQRSGCLGPRWATDAYRREDYAHWVEARLKWHREQAAINQGNAEFMKSVMRHFERKQG